MPDTLADKIVTLSGTVEQKDSPVRTADEKGEEVWIFAVDQEVARLTARGRAEREICQLLHPLSVNSPERGALSSVNGRCGGAPEKRVLVRK